MGILAMTADERVTDVKFTKDTLSVNLRDGPNDYGPTRLVSSLVQCHGSPAEELADRGWRLRHPLAGR